MISSFSSVNLISPSDVERKIIAVIQTGDTKQPSSTLVGSGFDMPEGGEQPGLANIVYIEPDPVEIEGIGGVLRLQDSATVVTAEIQDIISANTISTVTRAITQTQQIEIPNNAISNVNYYENAAYLDLDLNIGDTIVYIPDTSKFAPNGRLLIGNEIVFYNRKINDRFLQVNYQRLPKYYRTILVCWCISKTD